ncbi:hypothetical protein G9A89_020575 [Geosiphon pyriformis]|nr:hypothetical protein G9A89_020575 [Geosiphon pyriformis]
MATSFSKSTPGRKKKVREIPSRYMQTLNNKQLSAAPKDSIENILKVPSLTKSKERVTLSPLVNVNTKNVTPIATTTPRDHPGNLRSSTLDELKPSLIKKRQNTSRVINASKRSDIKRSSDSYSISSIQGLTSSKTSEASEQDNLSMSLDDEVAMLNARLNQWCFINAKSFQSFEFQKQAAETQILEAWELLVRKKQELSEAQRRFELEKEIILLQETLSVQRDQLHQTVQQLEDFKACYIPFASSLSNTIVAMPVMNAETGDIVSLSEQIKECSDAVAKIIEDSKIESSMVHEIAQIMHQLCTSTREKIQELNDCKALLHAISEAETLERSLRIQNIEMSSKKIRPKKLD